MAKQKTTFNNIIITTSLFNKISLENGLVQKIPYSGQNLEDKSFVAKLDYYEQYANYHDTNNKFYFFYHDSINNYKIAIFPDLKTPIKNNSNEFNNENYFQLLSEIVHKKKDSPKENNLYIIHRKDLQESLYDREKYRKINEFNIITFSHDDLYETYRILYIEQYSIELINDSIEKEVVIKELFEKLIDRYIILSKPWNELLHLRNKLIAKEIIDIPLYDRLKHDFILKNNHSNPIDLINEIEELIVKSPIQRI